MGAQPATKSDHEQGLSFVLGVDKLHILILRPEDMMRRNAILDSILNLSTLKLSYQLVYLAAPRIFGTSIDASIFKAHGIGLLLYDERRIDEAMPAQLQREQQLTPQREENGLGTELAALKSMYLEMQRTVSELRSDLATLRIPQPVQQLEPRLLNPTHPAATEPSFPRSTLHPNDLPSYFVNNPWLEVLSKRGSGEREPIAG